MAQTSIITGQYVSIHLTAATVLQRFCAWLIDILLLGFVWSMGLGIIAMLTLNFRTLAIVSIIIFSILIASYPLVAEAYFNGQTLGKKIVGIRVMCLDGTTPSLGAYFLRWLLLLLDYSMALGLTFIVFTRNSQRIGDLAAGTTVVRISRDRSALYPYRFNFADLNYRPIYQQATNLSMKQIQVITRVLYQVHDDSRQQKLLQLAEKTRRVLDISVPPGTIAEVFLINVYNDYHYFMSHPL
uniref:RDD family protein n=1 Tax=uncultured bacterium Csd4 TaxID=1637487 RepID=A0A0F6YRX2_9BACT|nr:RDD family protein [uncultured bacterium Csd4]